MSAAHSALTGERKRESFREVFVRLLVNRNPLLTNLSASYFGLVQRRFHLCWLKLIKTDETHTSPPLASSFELSRVVS